MPSKQLFIQVEGSLYSIFLSTADQVNQDLKSIEQDLGQPLKLSYCGVPVSDESHLFTPEIPDHSTLIAYVPNIGGKGGFGALLRGLGRDPSKQVDNFDACRDLSGRRLRHVEAQQKLAEWERNAPQRRQQKQQEKEEREKERKRQIESIREQAQASYREKIEASSSATAALQSIKNTRPATVKPIHEDSNKQAGKKRLFQDPLAVLSDDDDDDDDEDSDSESSGKASDSQPNNDKEGDDQTTVQQKSKKDYRPLKVARTTE